MGVSFVSIFILIYQILFWVCGFARSLAWDYAPGVPQGEAAERRLHWREKPIGRFVHKHIIWRNLPLHEVTEEDPQRAALSSVLPAVDRKLGAPENMQAIEEGRASPAPPESLSIVQQAPKSLQESTHQRPEVRDNDGALDPPTLKRFLKAVAVVLTPINSMIAISLVVALVQPLKALFVDTSDVGGPSWAGPDGNPPLSFIIDTGSQRNALWQGGGIDQIIATAASFIGALTVPLALILLGASFARMRVPRPLSRLPVWAIVFVCLAKMVLLPVVGIFLVRGMVERRLISRESKAELFVAMFLSGTPTAVK